MNTFTKYGKGVQYKGKATPLSGKRKFTEKVIN